MTPLQYIVEPAFLLLTWQPADESSSTRTRRVVGKLCEDNGLAAFRYLQGTTDFEIAKDGGFKGFPAFDVKQLEPFKTGAMEPFFRRLPPRSRDDFTQYLQQYRLPSPFPGSDLALLGYTGARLPSDGFGLVPIFDLANQVPLDYIVEVAGLRHVFDGQVGEISSEDPVEFRRDSMNAVEEDAVAIYWRGIKIGFVNRALRQTFCRWVDARVVTATVDRVNGKPERPLVYVRVEVR